MHARSSASVLEVWQGLTPAKLGDNSDAVPPSCHLLFLKLLVINISFVFFKEKGPCIFTQSTKRLLYSMFLLKPPLINRRSIKK